MGSKFKVLLFETMHAEGTRFLAEKCELVYAKSFDEPHLISLVGDVDAIVIRANGAVSRAVIGAAGKLKVIGRHGVGLDGIDLDAARERGIQVVYTPIANTESVAEHFVAIALMLAKKMKQGDIAVRQGNWKARYELIGTELRGKALGVLGFGRIGQQTARICHYGFSMPVVYYDVISYPEAEAEFKAVRAEMEEVCRKADFISVNLPLLPDTRGCINAGLIGHMKSSAILVNMARGPIWNEADVLEALKTGRIAAAGADVFEEEPTPAQNPLFTVDNFVGTPHMAAHTDEGMMRMSLVAKDVLAVLEGRRPEFPVPGSVH
ncbi:MAG: hydroxyacid dehydrogenase [Deltaproteobacteria bacterium]|nr:hydroxyacid dehydrogenase [Deltaproteobacteria bacterium]